MSKKGKRILSLFVFFATIISFLPINLAINEEKADAAVQYKDVTVVGQTTQGIEVQSISKGDKEFELKQGMPYVWVAVEKSKYNGVSDSELLTKMSAGETAVTDQQLILTAINGVDVSGASSYEMLNSKLKDKLGCELHVDGDASVVDAAKARFGSHTMTIGGKQYIGISIAGLPYGVNSVSYKIKETSVTKVKLEDGTEKLEAPKTETYPSGKSETITIYHATQIISSTIQDVDIISWIGENEQDFNNSDQTNNVKPFKYNDKAEKVEGYPLKYIFNIPDSTRTLKYIINFNGNVSGNAELLLNGNEITSQTQGNKVSGYLESQFDKAILIIRFQNSIGGDGNNLVKSYAMEINYNQLNVDNDYTLRDAGLTKYEYADEKDVIAYVEKEFTRDPNESDLTYVGNIHIDPRAKKISIDPKLGVTEGTIAFKYKDEDTVMKDGKLFVDFNGLNKVITIEGFKAQNGAITDYSKVLVRYRFNVITDGNGDENPIKLDFGDSAYLTQPGRETKIDFNEDRYTYDMYSKDRVDVTLTSPQTTKNEYIRVWFGKTTSSSQLVEAKESIKNNENTTPGSKKSNSLSNIDVADYQKMVVQSYYDKIEYEKDENGNDTTVVKSITPYKLGHEYVFYIQKNIDDSDNNEEISSDASLKDLEVESGKLVDSDGNKGFSSDKYAYTVTVPKKNESTEITAVANAKVQEITATISETGDSYDMESGKALKIPLNSSGKTTVKIKVTATDKVSTKTYTLVINNNDKGSDSGLSNLIVDPGEYDFDPDEKTTKVRVELNVSKVEITPIPSDSKSKVYIDDEKFNGSPKVISLKGQQETEVEIEVVSEDGTTSKTYTVKIVRRDSDDVVEDTDDDDDDVFYDEYNECWVDTSKYEEWGKVKGKDVYFDKRGRQVKNSWITVGKYGDYKYYYLDAKGYKQSGWITDSTGKRYYLDPVTGERKSGYIFQDGKWYYLDESGTMHTGWLYDKKDNGWQYFLPSGQMVTNTSMSINGKVYNFGIDGKIF